MIHCQSQRSCISWALKTGKNYGHLHGFLLWMAMAESIAKEILIGSYSEFLAKFGQITNKSIKLKDKKR